MIFRKLAAKLGAVLLGGALLAVTQFGAASADAQPSVKIGVLTDMSSVYADYAGPGSVDAARLAIEDAGMGGKVELLSADHQNKPDVGVSIARDWFEAKGVDAIFDVPTSSVALAVNGVAGKNRKLVFYSTAIIDKLTEEDCNGYGLAWTWDIYSVSRSVALMQLKRGMDTWFIIAQDYAAGHAMQAMIQDLVTANGGKVLGSARHPLGETDYSSYLIQAQASGAKIVAFTAGGTDLLNAMKQAREFGVTKRGQTVGTMYTIITDVKAIGLDAMQGLNFVSAFYWDRDDETRAFAKRFMAVHHAMPTMFQAGVYSSVLNYLKAVRATGSKDADTVRGWLRDQPDIEDAFARHGKLLPNGRFIHDMLVARVKTPAESKYAWDFYDVLGVVPAAEAFRTIEQSKCKLR